MWPFIRHLLLQALAVWAVGHLLMLAAALGAAVPADPLRLLRPSPAGALFLSGVVTAAVLLAWRRRNEDLLLANLGVPAWRVAAVIGGWTVVLEVLLAAATA